MPRASRMPRVVARAPNRRHTPHPHTAASVCASFCVPSFRAAAVRYDSSCPKRKGPTPHRVLCKGTRAVQRRPAQHLTTSTTPNAQRRMHARQCCGRDAGDMFASMQCTHARTKPCRVLASQASLLRALARSTPPSAPQPVHGGRARVAPCQHTPHSHGLPAKCHPLTSRSSASPQRISVQFSRHPSACTLPMALSSAPLHAAPWHQTVPTFSLAAPTHQLRALRCSAGTSPPLPLGPPHCPLRVAPLSYTAAAALQAADAAGTSPCAFTRPGPQRRPISSPCPAPLP